MGTAKHLGRGYSPPLHPDKIGIRFTQNDIPHTLIDLLWVNEANTGINLGNQEETWLTLKGRCCCRVRRP